MRLDLYNHTISLGNKIAWRNSAKHIHLEKYLYAIQYHKLDGIAITNRHNITEAVVLAREYPTSVIVGCEYQVAWKENTTVSIVVLNLDTNFHEILLQERLKGLPHFCEIVRNQNYPFFMVSLASGIPQDHPFACELLEESLQYIDALAVVDAYEGTGQFAIGLANYYNLATIGGSGHLVCSNRRAYTESLESTSLSQFWKAIQNKKVSVGITYEIGFSKGAISSIWELGKNFYRKEVENLKSSEEIWEIQQPSAFENWIRLGQTIITPLIYSIPQSFRLQKKQSMNHKLENFGQKFIVYLKNKQTRQIYSTSDSLIEKKRKWNESILKICQSFQHTSIPADGFPTLVHKSTSF